MSSQDDEGKGVTEAEVDELRLKVNKEGLKIAYLFLSFLSTNFIPLLLMGVISGLAILLPSSLNVAMDPITISVGGGGTPVTQLINALVILEVIRNTITLYRKGQPRIVTDPSVLEAGSND